MAGASFFLDTELLEKFLESKPVGFAYTAVVKGAVAFAKAARPPLKP